MADITLPATNADLPTAVLKVREVVTAFNAAQTALDAALIKLNEIYDTFPFPSETPTPAANPTTPATEFTVTISAVARTFKFKVPKFIWKGTTYLSTTLATVLTGGDTAERTAARVLVTELVAAGSLIDTDGDGSGVLEETTA